MMLNLILTITPAVVAGAAAGLITTRWLLSHQHRPSATVPVEPADPFISAEIDRAAARWATESGRPEAAGIMADKLHMLYALGRRKGWQR